MNLTESHSVKKAGQKEAMINTIIIVEPLSFNFFFRNPNLKLIFFILSSMSALLKASDFVPGVQIFRIILPVTLCSHNISHNSIAVTLCLIFIPDSDC